MNKRERGMSAPPENDESKAQRFRASRTTESVKAESKMSRADQAPSANPRAFVVGTGFVLQVVGLILLFGGCGLWSLSGFLVAPADEPVSQWLGFFSERLGAAVWTIGVALGFVGGIALAAVGVGLQGQRPGSGRLAMVITAVMALVYGAIAVALIAREGRWGASVVPALLAILSFALFLLAGHSAAVLRRFPPPPDQSDATQEVLAEIRREREERLRRYDP